MRDAAKDQADLIGVSYFERTDLAYASDEEMEKAYLQYVSGWMFDSFGLHPAPRPPVHGKRRLETRGESNRGDLLRLLGPPFR